MFNAFQNALKHCIANWGCCCSRIRPKVALSQVGSARCDYFVFMSSTKRVSVNNCSQGVRPLLASFFLAYLQRSPMFMLTYATRGMSSIRLCRAPQIFVPPSPGEHYSFPLPTAPSSPPGRPRGCRWGHWPTLGCSQSPNGCGLSQEAGLWASWFRHKMHKYQW